jgi:hypothetical protein
VTQVPSEIGMEVRVSGRHDPFYYYCIRTKCCICSFPAMSITSTVIISTSLHTRITSQASQSTGCVPRTVRHTRLVVAVVGTHRVPAVAVVVTTEREGAVAFGR